MLYTLQAKLLAGAVALLLVLGGLGALYWHAYNKGQENVQAKWDASVREIKDLTDKQVTKDRDVGYQAAVELQQKLSVMETRYASLSSQYQRSLKTKVSCPASGEVGDVVLPAELVDSLFIAAKRSVPASGPAPTRTDSRVQ